MVIKIFSINLLFIFFHQFPETIIYNWHLHQAHSHIKQLPLPPVPSLPCLPLPSSCKRAHTLHVPCAQHMPYALCLHGTCNAARCNYTQGATTKHDDALTITSTSCLSCPCLHDTQLTTLCIWRTNPTKQTRHSTHITTCSASPYYSLLFIADLPAYYYNIRYSKRYIIPTDICSRYFPQPIISKPQ